MNFIDEFRDKTLVQKILKRLNAVSSLPAIFMEVCGGHTMSIQKFGIPSLLPQNIELVSGPGCPVCVTDRRFIDQAIAYSRLKDVIITTYGDLIKVPGSSSSLDIEKGTGADIRMVYSTLEALKIAVENPNKNIIFLGIGFETTTPSTAVAIKEAYKNGIGNFFIFSSHKTMPAAMKALIDEGSKISGYIAPGHVSTITGIDMYLPIASKYKLPVVVSGFEPVDILQSILLLTELHENKNPQVKIQYKRAVKEEGNIKAQSLVEEIFKPKDDWWRGLGVIKDSGLAIRSEYEKIDAEKQFKVEVEKTIEPKGCICGEILKGLKKPNQCALFAKACTPLSPVGACMVSNEGACQAYYKYNRHAK